MSNPLIKLKAVLVASYSIFLFGSCNTDTKKAETNGEVHKLYTVEIKQMKFEPTELTIEKGDTVVWINHDIVPHDVTEVSKKTWTSSLMPVNASWRLVVAKSADYYCSIHVIMKGKLIVQ